MPKRSNKSTDPIKSAKRLLDEIIAKHDPKSITLERVKETEASGKNIAAVALGRLGALNGGKARANSLSARNRKQIAKKGAQMKLHTNSSASEYQKPRRSVKHEMRESPMLADLPGQFGSILIDPPWRFTNRTGKMAPEHKRLRRYPTMSFAEIAELPIKQFALDNSHLYLWCPNALLLEALSIMKAWGYTYKTNIVWYKIRKDGGPDGRGVGFYFRNVTELLLFGVRGRLRTLAPGRSQVNILATRKREHSRKPEEVYDLIKRCSPGPYLELFARERTPGWTQWGKELDTYELTRPLYKAYNGARINTPTLF